MPLESDEAIREVLGLRTVAVVGCSTTPGKDAHEVPAYLAERNYEIVPVNPTADEVLGRPAYDSLADVDEEIDTVCVFRPGEELSGIVDEAIAREDVRAIWTQRGVRDPEATARAEAENLTVVEDRCMRVEHRKLCG